MKLKEIQDGVFFSNAPVLGVHRHDIERLIALAGKHPQKRVRLCAHHTLNDEVHEMIIVMLKGSYVRPHMHRNKVESFHIIAGTADYVELNEQGDLTSIVPMGVFESGKQFFFRNPALSFHTWNVISDVFVVHEVTNGPFYTGASIYAPWSPKESNMQSVSNYICNLAERIRNTEQKPFPAEVIK